MVARGSEETSVLIVEDAYSLATLYQHQLEKAGIKAEFVETGKEALAFLEKSNVDVLLLDIQLPDQDGSTLLETLAEQGKAPTAVMITAHGSINKAVEVMQRGASDFLMKPVSEERLVSSIKNALERSKTGQASVTVHKTAQKIQTPGGFVGSSERMKTVYANIKAVASSRAPVFITGESGTGKEICAESIHGAGDRAGGPFIAINCAAVPKDLIESELFGHKKGAFTGATADRMGAALSANNGTLFLDEICEMELDLQAKLLRFLQTGKVQRVGDDTVFDTDIRIICATNRYPIEEVAARRFREDLYYRLHVLTINMPPLRKRGGDILELAETFLKQASALEGKSFERFDTAAQNWLLSHLWPGNVRELENMIRRIVVMNEGVDVTLEMLSGTEHPDFEPPAPLSNPAASPSVLSPLSTQTNGQTLAIDINRPLLDIERDIIEHAISFCDGSLPSAAKMLQVSPSTLYRKRESWERPDETEKAD